jgi:hypothetical protein
MARSQTVVAGIAWFRSDQWQLLRSLAFDADILEQTHAAWESLDEKTIKDLARTGLVARKVDVDVNDLRVWCTAQQRPLDASARAAYATVRLRDEGDNA